MADIVMVKHPVGFVWVWEDDIPNFGVELERVRPDRYMINSRERLIQPNEHTLLEVNGKVAHYSARALRDIWAPWLVERGSH